jgi:hypothetical protein
MVVYTETSAYDRSMAIRSGKVKFTRWYWLFCMVREAGLEPARLPALDPGSSRPHFVRRVFEKVTRNGDLFWL